jgi:hypothetical protein
MQRLQQHSKVLLPLHMMMQQKRRQQQVPSTQQQPHSLQ